ncbi:MAG: thioredoxin-disulfide reductase [Acidimicrobiia bacterium]|nr:thioredoxin-disulfide reductase [Acidimicrobiia bacterium]MYC57550.1 thioredoxin-disulfide reductase [Acidimicrobiia bacterium]MYI30086.1 thioredoxin-disulfide reductase [Acidimicrobiia bacterium]
MDKQDNHKVVIIGSGPAGLTAAIYTARANLNPLVIEGTPSSTSNQPGGQLMLTTDVENYPGFPQGIMGPELMTQFREQAQRFGAEILTDKVTRVDLTQLPHSIWVGDPNKPEPTYHTWSVIISTGAEPLTLGLEAEQRLIGRGVSTCATCDGFFFTNQHIAIVGGGDSAMEEAIFLTRFASKVTVIHRRDKLRASKIMQDRAFANDRIEFLWNSTVSNLIGQNQLEAVEVINRVTNKTSVLDITGLFIAIGHRPNTDLFTDQLHHKQNGYLLTKPNSSHTEIAGVFACGDVQDDVYRQAITAAGSGCMAAIDAERWLESVGHG